MMLSQGLQLLSSRGHLLTAASLTLLLAIVLKAVFEAGRWVMERWTSLSRLVSVPMPRKHWLFGHALQLVPDCYLQNTRRWVRDVHDRAYHLWVGPGIMNVVDIHHPDLTRSLLASKEPKGDLYNLLKTWIGEGLIVSTGQRWARDRRLLTPAFHFDILKQYLQVFNQSVTQMLDLWTDSVAVKDEPLEMFENVSTMTLNALLKCTFGVDCNEDVQGTQRYLQSVRQMSELLIARCLSPHLQRDFVYFLTPRGRQWKRNCDFMHAFSRKFIERRRKLMENPDYAEKSANEKKHLDFLDMLLTSKDSDGNGMSDQEIQEQVDTFMFAGHDTTASAISYCLYNLASHPVYQERCREEVRQLLQDRNHLTWDDLGELTYLSMCIKESLRLDPPVPIISRKLAKPLKLDEHTYDAGTWITINIYGLHHNPSVWTDPEVYNPERFSAENSLNNSSHSFTPFSAGPRNCIGQQFALTELKVAVALTLLRFRLDIVADRPCHRSALAVLRSASGVWIKLSPLQQ